MNAKGGSVLSTAELSPAKKALLEKRLRGATQRPEGQSCRRREARPTRLPLSFAQQRLWFLDQLAPGNPVYNIFQALRIKGPLNVGALEKSFALIVARHEAIRTTFGLVDGQPVQIIHDNPNFKLSEIDLRPLPPQKREETAQRLAREEAARPLDLTRDLMLRATLLELDAEDHVLLVTMHHIASDGWSMGVLFRELGQSYNALARGAEPALPALPMQYADYALWQRQSLTGAVLENQLAYWKGQLAGAPEILELPTDRPRPAEQSFRGASEVATLPPGLARGLSALSREEGVTLYMTLLAAFATLLHRYTRQNDIVIGSPIAGRAQTATEGLIGFFINTLALRADLSGDPAFRELLRRVRQVTLDAYAHQDVPFDKLVVELQPERSSSHTPLFQVMFALQSAPSRPLELTGLTITPVEVDNGTAKFDLTLAISEEEHGLVLDMEYNQDLFEGATIRRMLGHFQALLEGVVAHPEQRVSELPIMGAAERHQVVVEWNQTAADYPKNTPVHALFEHQVECTPEAIALQHDRQLLTYRELNARANQLAHYLLSLGVRPEDRIGIYLDRTPELFVALLAILKAGAAYLPLDRSYPKDRIAFMLEDAQAPLLLSEQRFAGELPGAGSRMVFLDRESKEIARQSRLNPPSATTGESLAYVIYTSGSTGRPKGACIPHRAINRLVINSDYVRLGSSDVIAQASNVSFDAATFEIWGAFLNGGRLVVMTKDLVLSPKEFAEQLRKNRVSALFLTTALFNLMAREVPGAFATVRNVLFGGEAADPRWVAEVLKRSRPKRLINIYGPTETTTFAAWYRCDAVPENARSLPIGRPLANAQLYVLDEHLQPLPIGVPGELYIGGGGVARGYLNRAELTADKFIANPFSAEPGARLYKTGDLVRYLTDGNIEFLGRIDLQVKIRGFRVEIGEIETVLSQQPAVQECAVTVREDVPGDKRLVAYFVSRPEGTLTVEMLREYLQQRLPEYMVPVAFVRLLALPINPNGKVNRRALPAPEPAAAERPSVSARDTIEERLVAIWESVLNVRPIGVKDRFFHLGGHSLLAVKLVSEIEQAFGQKLSVSSVFRAPTIEQLATVLRGGELSSGGSSIVDIQPRGRRPPLFLVHGAGGGMFWGYQNLSRHMGDDQPVYVIRSCAMDGDGREEFKRIEEMAAQYVADLRAFQPRGPYCLGGYCFGGNVAYEMARLLMAQGEQVAFLALMNCAPPNSSYTRFRWSPARLLKFLLNLGLWIGNIRDWNPQQRREFLRWKLRTARNRLRAIFHGKAPCSAHEDVDEIVDLSSHTEEQRKLWATHVRALLEYHPAPFAGHVTLYRSRVHQFLCSFDSACGWGELARGGVTVKVVPGPHEGILEEPHVRALARELKAELEAAQKEHDSGPPPPNKQKIEPLPARTPAEPAAIPAMTARDGVFAATETNLEPLMDYPQSIRRTGIRRGESLALPDRLFQMLKQFSQREAVAISVVLLAAFAILIARTIRDEQLSVRVRLGHRGRPHVQYVIGRLPHAFDIHLAVSPDSTIRDMLVHLRNVFQSVLEHIGFPLGKLAAELLSSADQPRPAPRVGPEFADGTAADLNASSTGRPPQLELRVDHGEQQISIEYDADHFQSSTVRRLLARLETMVAFIMESPHQRVADAPLLTAAERQQVLMDWNATAADFPLHKSWPQLFEEQVARTPSGLAVRCGARQLTYQELDERAGRFAAELRARGVETGNVVAVALERSLDLATAIVGIMKAGAVYLPVDLASPRERLAEMLSDARPTVIVAHQKWSSRLPLDGGEILWLENRDFTRGPAAGFGLPGPMDLAYVMYTSGSTGKPKGVQIQHRSLVNHNCAMVRSFQLGEPDRVLQFSSLSFDISVEEMLPTWLAGAAVVFRPDDVLSSMQRLFDFLEEERITVLDIPTAFWHELVEFLPLRALPESLRLVVIGGERASAQSFQTWKRHASERVRLINTYGPTEGTVTVTEFEARTEDDHLCIGRPIANVAVYVLSDDGQPCPIGVPGELYIGGACVAAGYLNSPELTAARFTANPFSNDPNERLYRTGDLARWRADDNLEFIGRADHQIKIRGFRVEPGEIEAALASHPAVAECVVLPSASPPAVLNAYFAPRSAFCPSEAALLEFLRQKLPDYMVPARLVQLERLPRNARGKIDRDALHSMPPAEERYTAPRNDIESQIAEIWCEVLGLERIGVEDNFFRLGGHSLHAMRVTSRLHEAFDEDISAAEIFDHPTVGSLAASIFGLLRRRKGSKAGPIARVSRRQNIPVSFAQQRLWFLQQLEPSSAAYHIPQALRLEGELNIPALKSSLSELVRRHEALRTVYLTIDSRPAQTILPPADVTLSEIDLRERPTELEPCMEEEARQPFDLSRDLMLRATLLRLADDEHVLLLTIHHIAADAWSVGVMLDELAELYRAYIQGQPSPLPDLAIQYADFAQWQRGWLRGALLEEQLEYWKQRLAGAPSLLELPADRPRPAIQSSQGARQKLALSANVVADLRRIAEQEGCTLFMALLAAFQTLLSRYTGLEDILVGCPTANRTRSELERVVGFFVNTLVLRTDASGNPTFRDFLSRARETILGAYAHQDVPFETLVDELRPARDPSYHPLFRVMFVLQNAPMPRVSLDGLSWKPFDADIGTSKFDLTLELTETDNGAEGWFEYSTDLFDAWRIERMAAHFQMLLEGIVQQPDKRLSELPLLTAEDRHRLDEWNSAREEVPRDKCIHHLFEAQAVRTPDRVALVFGEQALTYKELNRRADQLAGVLRSLGVGPDRLVGLCMERSLEMIVAILGVLKAGGAYVPMDPAYPRDRVAFMLEDSRASVLVTQQRLLSLVRKEQDQGTRTRTTDEDEAREQEQGTSPVAGQIVCLDDSRPEVISALGGSAPPIHELAGNGSIAATPRHLAYVIYTSGSTGKPKGVAVEHRSVVAFLHWARGAFSDDELGGTLFATSICFDLSVFEMFAPLSWGGTIILADNALQWSRIPAARRVSLVNTVPSVAAEWVRSGELPESVQTINLAGEPLSQALVEQIYQRWPHVRKVNDLYGPTETTVYSTFALRQPGGRATIGRPLVNEQIFLLDRHQNRVPIGVAGELYIGGAGLAREYLGRPDLTAEKFISIQNSEFRIQNSEGLPSIANRKSKIENSPRLYRTGDLARFYPDGAIEYLGRIDHQVKVRGYRIELGEIEQRLREHPQVREAVVVADDRNGERQLIAYVVGHPANSRIGGAEPSELRALLKRHLPDYMLPSTFVELDALPLTPNGKVDRKALPAATDRRPAAREAYVAPSTLTEKMLAGIWCEVLGLENVGATDNFFERGGHSLLITKVLSRLRETIDLELPMRVMFDAPTITELSRVVETALMEEVGQLSEEEAERLDASMQERLEESRA